MLSGNGEAVHICIHYSKYGRAWPLPDNVWQQNQNCRLLISKYKVSNIVWTRYFDRKWHIHCKFGLHFSRSKMGGLFLNFVKSVKWSNGHTGDHMKHIVGLNWVKFSTIRLSSHLIQQISHILHASHTLDARRLLCYDTAWMLN